MSLPIKGAGFFEEDSMATAIAVSDLVEGNFTCCLHFEGKSATESLLELTSAKADKGKECAEKWLATSKQPERSVAARFLEGFHGDSSRTRLYHKRCYLRLVAQNKLQIALSRKRKVSRFDHKLVCYC